MVDVMQSKRRKVVVDKRDNVYSGKCIFKLMEIPSDELKELTIEEFAREIGRNSKVNIHAHSDNGDFVLGAYNANILVNNEGGVNRMHIFEWDSYITFNISERVLFGIYSYENNKNYRISFEGNSPDLLITKWNDRDNKKTIKEATRSIIMKYKMYDNNIDAIQELKELIEEMEES